MPASLGQEARGEHCRGEPGPHSPHPDPVVKEEAQNLIKQFFHGRARCESEADWHGLCDPQR